MIPLILDGAVWQGASDLVIPPNLSLLTLPPYSPELNPATGHSRKRLTKPACQPARSQRLA
jgi:transposase